MRKIVYIFAALLYTLGTFISPLFVQAKDQPQADYSVVPILPDNQNKDVRGYFDLLVTPKQRQEIRLQIMNHSNQDQTYKMEVNTATTNENGIIDYSQPNFSKDESMRYALKDYIHIPEKKVTVSAGKEKVISLQITAPPASFQGILLGGVTITPLKEQKDKKTVNNVFTHTTAILLREKGKEQPTPELKAGDVQLSQVNYHNVVKLLLRNPTPTIIQPVQATINIIKKGEKKPFLSSKKENMSIAPNSRFYLPIEWGALFVPGEYTYQVNLTDSKKKWSFSRDFTVKSQEAQKWNTDSVDEGGPFSWWLWIGSALVVLILLLITIFLIRKNKKWKLNGQ